MVPAQMLASEKKHCNDGEHHERDGLLHHLKLHERERASVAGIADAICRNHEAVFRERNEPGEQDHADERPVGADAGLLQFEMAIPRYGHEDVGNNEEEDSGYLR